MLRLWTGAVGLEKRGHMRKTQELEQVVLKYSILFGMTPKFNTQINKNVSPLVQSRPF